jgi:hypothetical protein
MNIAGPSAIRRFCAALALSFFVIASSASVSADSATAGAIPTIRILIEDGPNPATWSWTPAANELRPSGAGSYQLISPREFDILSNRAHVLVQGLEFDPDPFVLNNILVTNTTTSTQIFSAFVGVPTTFGAPNLISGSILTGVIDGGFDGASVTSASPTAIYQAQIDSSTVATLQNHPFSLIAPAAGLNSATASFGPLPSAIPVNSNIGIQLRFALTAGDTASILSRFDVTAVPEPGSFALVGLGLALVTRRSRRSR